MAEQKQKKPFHEVVAENLIEQLKQGTAPWQKPWNPGESGGILPMNGTTSKRYRGINAIHLMSQGYNDQRWMTYKQAAGVGAQVRRGEKGTMVQYWKFSEEQAKRDKDGRIMLDNDNKPIKEVVQLERPKVFYAVVFNAEQIDGLPPLVRQEKSWNGIERADAILKASGADIRHDQVDRAFYRTSTDSIHLPEQQAFPSADRYYATALHELGHWTGHASRLDRDLAHPFGSEGYAKEELRAEISSMILGDELGIGHDPEQHVAYVKSWIKALQDDPLEIFRAASDAEKIQDHVLSLAQEQTQQQEPVTLAQTQQEDEQAEIMAYAHTQHEKAVEGYSVLETIINLQRTATELGYQSKLNWQESDIFPDAFNVRVSYQNAGNNDLAIHTEITCMDGKALTSIGESRVPGTGYTSDTEWQSDALKAAFASVNDNQILAAKKLQHQIEEISSDPRDIPDSAKFPRGWLQDSSLLASNPSPDQRSLQRRDVSMNEQSTYVSFVENERRFKAEKFILSNIGDSLTGIVEKMNRDQLKLSQEVVKEALNSAPSSDFWMRNKEFSAAFSQDWLHVESVLKKAESQIATMIKRLPSKLYSVVQNPGEGESLILETNSAIKALDTVKAGNNLGIRDLGIIPGFGVVNDNLIDVEKISLRAMSEEERLQEMKDDFISLGFSDVLKIETNAINKGLIPKGQEIKVLMVEQANHWYTRNVEAVMDNSGGSIELSKGLDALGPEPNNEPIFMTDMGERYIPDMSLMADRNLAEENTLINVPYKERNEAKSLGAKWDRNEQSWYVPQGVELAPFAKWQGEETVNLDNTPEEKIVGQELQGREYLAVPYKERQEAKDAGAKWDKEKKSWYAGEGADLEKLAKWKLENVLVEQPPAMSLKDEVEAALRDIGCILDADTDKGQKHPILDGEKHRITVEGDKNGEKSGFYRIYTDGHPAGFMQNNRTKEELRWSSKGYLQTDEEKAVLRAEAAAKQGERAARQQRDHEASASRVVKQLGQLSTPGEQTQYLEKKGLQVHAGVYTDKEGAKTYIPAYDENGKQWSMQYINEDGTKRFAKNARKEGCFHVVGGLDALKDAPVLIIAEGYATAASITEATGNATVAAFDSGNLEPVAKALKNKYPDKPIIIAGDDDRQQICKITAKNKDSVNVGREKAQEAAQSIGGVAIFPVFAAGEVPTKEELSQIKPAAYKAHQAAQRKLEQHATSENSLTENELKVLEAVRLSDKQQEILKRAERHTDFNDLAVNSSLGREGVARQIKTVISNLSQKREQDLMQAEKLVQVKEQKKTHKRSM